MTSDNGPRAADRRDRTAPPEALHNDLADAAAREAARDAENVVVFLHALGFMPSADRPLRLPPAFLLHLGAALRLLVWESIGLQVHRDLGLPGAEQAIVDAFGHLDAAIGAEALHRDELPRRVIALFAGRFAWHARGDLDADVVLDDDVEEGDLVDAVAQLLWEARHARSQSSKPVTEVGDG